MVIGYQLGIIIEKFKYRQGQYSVFASLYQLIRKEVGILNNNYWWISLDTVTLYNPINIQSWAQRNDKTLRGSEI